MVVIVGETLIEVPEPTEVPPQEPLYHCHVVALFNDPDVMFNVVLWVPQFEVELAPSVGVVGLMQADVPVPVRLITKVPSFASSLAIVIAAVLDPVADGLNVMVNVVFPSAATGEVTPD